MTDHEGLHEALAVATLLPLAAFAQTAGVLATKRPITWGMIFALLFLMLGPIKLLGTFAVATKNSDRVFRFRLATRAFLFAIAAVTIAAGLGTRMLENFAIPVLVLQVAAGLILFLVALQAVMQQYNTACPPARAHRATDPGARLSPRIPDDRDPVRHCRSDHSHGARARY